VTGGSLLKGRALSWTRWRSWPMSESASSGS
jgi:hypothetical protein